MARTVRDTKRRLGLKAQRKPYFKLLDPGSLHIGYRRLRGGAGTWLARALVPGQQSVAGKKQPYVIERLATADDFSNSNGVDVLSFAQAQVKAREWRDSRSRASGKAGPLTVASACEDYLHYLKTEKKSEPDTRKRYNAFIRDQLGGVLVDALTAKQIRAWHHALADKPARVRTREGDKQRYRALGTDAEAIRRRRSTANRVLVTLRAALNRAWQDGKAHSDEAWRRVRPFKETAAARVRYLQIAEAQRLINASDSEFRKVVEAAL